PVRAGRQRGPGGDWASGGGGTSGAPGSANEDADQPSRHTQGTSVGSSAVTARGEVLWTPAPDAAEATRIGVFMRWLAEEQGRQFASYHDLWAWSVQDLEGFWGAFCAWAGVRWSSPPDRILA